MTTPFGARLVEAMAKHGPLCVGIDPHPGLLDAWGLPRNADGVRRFALRCVQAFAGQIAVVKPQSAFFEAYGSAGISALEQVIAGFRGSGTQVLVDAKRGDIGSTMDAYAQAYLADGSPLAGDAVTLSPYLGFGSLEPAVQLAQDTGRGIFVLVLTSNPEGETVQRAVLGDARPARSVAQVIVDQAAERNTGSRPLGGIGAVIGATLDRLDLDISALNGPILAPGFGAQGGTVDRLRTLFGPGLPGVLPTSSRDVLRHGPDLGSLRDAALRIRDLLANGG